MKPIPIYRYKRPDGGVTVSPIEPNCEYTEGVRLVADKGKLITKNGIDFYTVKDENSAEGWYEVDNPKGGEKDAVSDT